MPFLGRFTLRGPAADGPSGLYTASTHGHKLIHTFPILLAWMLWVHVIKVPAPCYLPIGFFDTVPPGEVAYFGDFSNNAQNRGIQDHVPTIALYITSPLLFYGCSGSMCQKSRHRAICQMDFSTPCHPAKLRIFHFVQISRATILAGSRLEKNPL